MTISRLLILISILFASLGPVTAGPAPVKEESSLPVSTAEAPLPPAEQNPFGLPLEENTSVWVVRAYYTDRQMVNELARWLEPWEVHHNLGYLVVAVRPDEYNLLLALGFQVEIDQELTARLNMPPVLTPGQVSGIPGYSCYRTVEETFASAAELASIHPELVAWIDIGDSWEKTDPGGLTGYDMKVLRLTNSAITGTKPKLFVISGIHAREYATAELVTRFAEYLVNNYDTDPDVTWLLDYHEIHLLLQSNPDGRKHAEDGVLWRKNTNANYCSSSWPGADLNRNFAFQWGCCGGSSTSPCNETYRGPSPASEPETQAVQNYLRAQFPDQRGPALSDPAPANTNGIFLDIHSYGHLVLWPWGFTTSLAPNATGLQTLGRKMAYFNDYSPEQSVGLYPTDGATDDFAYGDLGLAAYTIEVGDEFFESCANFTNSLLPDNLATLLYAAKAARTPYLTPAGPDVLSLSAAPTEALAGTAIQLTATINDTRYNNQNGTEPTQNIAAAEYYIDIPPWVTTTMPVAYPMIASDSAFDEKAEGVTAAIDTAHLGAGRHIIYTRGRDASGNWGPASAVFIYITSTFTLTPLESLLVGDPGETITHTLQLTNVGEISNTFTLTLNSVWQASVTTSKGPLPPGSTLTLLGGESLTIIVQITIPDQAGYNQADAATLVITPQDEPSLAQTATLITATRYALFLPQVAQ